jgi:hypothetical protein
MAPGHRDPCGFGRLRRTENGRAGWWMIALMTGKPVNLTAALASFDEPYSPHLGG